MFFRVRAFCFGKGLKFVVFLKLGYQVEDLFRSFDGFGVEVGGVVDGRVFQVVAVVDYQVVGVGDVFEVGVGYLVEALYYRFVLQVEVRYGVQRVVAVFFFIEVLRVESY